MSIALSTILFHKITRVLSRFCLPLPRTRSRQSSCDTERINGVRAEGLRITMMRSVSLQSELLRGRYHHSRLSVHKSLVSLYDSTTAYGTAGEFIV